jgi:nucleotide-binding universal stress UspA family protein
MSPDRKRILLTVDGSEQTSVAAGYLSKILPAGQAEVVLFHVMTKIPEAFWDWEKDPLWPQKTEFLRKWEVQQENKIRDFMERTQQVFIDAGFPRDALIIKIQKRQEGIARDLCAESHCNYDALVIGRKGLSTLGGLMLGSIANKVLARVTALSIWLIGANPAPRKVLLAVDASDAALGAADYVGRMLAATDCDVTLFHVVRDLTSEFEGLQGVLVENCGKSIMEAAANAIKPVFAAATTRLVAAGVPPQKIATKLVTGAKSRAGAIIAEAGEAGFGTIVVGRKALSQGEEFAMGQVSNKLAQLAANPALWLVS